MSEAPIIPGAPVRFEQRVPVGLEGLIANVRFSTALGLPELRDFEYPREEPLSIIANGPSARQAPLDGVTLAVNGALRLFTEKGLAPTFWAACDPQPLVADFLKDAPLETTYLVASKCHPSVFEALVGRRVVLWHVHEDATDGLMSASRVSSGVSVTICLFEVGALLGYRRFNVWGWDGCVFEDGQQHAIEQAPIEADLSIEMDGREYRSSPTWALEAEDAAKALRGFPFDVTIHGGGFMGDFLKTYLAPHFVTAKP